MKANARIITLAIVATALAAGLITWLQADHRDRSAPPMELGELVRAIERCGRLQATVEVHTDRRDRPQWVSCYWSSQDAVEQTAMIGGKESSEP